MTGHRDEQDEPAAEAGGGGPSAGQRGRQRQAAWADEGKAGQVWVASELFINEVANCTRAIPTATACVSLGFPVNAKATVISAVTMLSQGGAAGPLDRGQVQRPVGAGQGEGWRQGTAVPLGVFEGRQGELKSS